MNQQAGSAMNSPLALTGINRGQVTGLTQRNEPGANGDTGSIQNRDIEGWELWLSRRP
jgi:hypothetical protein